MRKRILLTFFINFCIVSVYSQGMHSVLNVGGGASTTLNNYSLIYSVGESLSIANFTITNNTTLQTGFLQVNPPIVTGINDIELLPSSAVTANPNPTTNFINIKANFNKMGQFQFQVLDAGSKMMQSSNTINISGSIEKMISLENYPAGVYYLRVLFQPTSGKTQLGTYKVVKL